MITAAVGSADDDVDYYICERGSGTPSFLGRERAAVNVDVGPERRSPRYHETCLALESVKESSAAVSKPRGVWLRMPIFKNLKEASRLPVRVKERVHQK